MGYPEGILRLSHDEVEELIADLRAVLVARAANTSAAGRRPYWVNAIFFPTEEPSRQSTGQSTDPHRCRGTGG